MFYRPEVESVLDLAAVRDPSEPALRGDCDPVPRFTVGVLAALELYDGRLRAKQASKPARAKLYGRALGGDFDGRGLHQCCPCLCLVFVRLTLAASCLPK